MSYYRSDSQTDHILTNLVTNVISANTSNFTNHSEVTQTHVFDLYEAFRTKESEQLSAYRSVAYVFGAIIFLSNLTVVVSSGLILRKGQQPKSTYLLLGNVSLADTIIGISIIFGASVENTTSSNPLCIFQIGMLVCPAMVSIFSVGMIAVDRYIYILHGLYYQRWFNTTKVRIGILCIWMIGVTLGFMPASGWVNKEMMIDSKCSYVSLFPGMLILLNSLLSIVPIILVAVLYSIILAQALKNVNQINTTKKTVRTKSPNDDPEIRIYRGNKTAVHSVKFVPKENKTTIKRSASFDTIDVFNKSYKLKAPKNISKSIHNLSSNKEDKEKTKNDKDYAISTNGHLLNLSTCTISSSTILNESISDIKPYTIAKAITNCKLRCIEKVKEPNKWRAVIIVMLTTGSFVFTWIPFFITVIFYVFCEEKLINPKCMDLRIMLGGPIAVLAFCNSILNPLIYAWWHKGFQRTIKMYFQKYLKSIIKKS
ncbi:unnamed protein product [Parnassius mnemosyne]|uniref:G-protein coupled receptors family 1 profile domain-containing protein n=1 Tax=Parnassius mnemosyne TaxID=213953 RepID=A0AAV1KLV6_9NEOP